MPTILVHPADITNEGLLDRESLIRLQKAFRMYEKLISKGVSPGGIYFVSSVQDRLKEGYSTQSEMMKEILVQWGVLAEQIITSNQSSDTLNDIRNSFQLIKNHNLPQPIINVSSWYHIPRIWLMWCFFRRQFGYPKVQYVFAGAANYSWILQEPKKVFKIGRLLRQLSGN